MQSLEHLLINKKKTILFMSILLILQIFVLIHYGKVKGEFLWIDEIWTFNLANRYYEPFLTDASKYYGILLNASFWNTTLPVVPGQEFSFGSVIYNQSQDVHPPLFYFIVHTISSTWPGLISKWMVIIPNIVFFVITQFFLFIIATRYLQSRVLGFLVCMFYGFSWGAINTVIFVRMYMMLTMFTVILVHAHTLLNANSKTCNLVKYSYLFCAMLLGTLTQYYFLIFAFFLGCMYSLFFVKTKQIKVFYHYSLTMVSSLVAAYLLFPAILAQLLGKSGNQGSWAVRNLLHSEYAVKLKAFWKIIENGMWAEQTVFLLVVAILVLFIYFIRYVYLINFSQSEGNYSISMQRTSNPVMPNKLEFNLTNIDLELVLLVATCILYFLLISKIAPFLMNRYMYCLFPFIAIFIVKGIFSLSRRKILNTAIMTMVMVLFVSAGSYGRDKIYDRNDRFDYSINKVRQEFSDNRLIAVNNNNSWVPIVAEIPYLSAVKESYLITEKELDQLHNIIKDYEITHNSILMFRANTNRIQKEQFIQFVISNTQYKHYEILDYYYGETILFYK